MALKNIKISDVSGAELKDDEAVRVVIKGHPKLSEGRQLDAGVNELDGLKSVANLVSVTVEYPDGTVKDLSVTATELEKVIPLSALEAADNLRGRRKNFRPNGA